VKRKGRGLAVTQCMKLKVFRTRGVGHKAITATAVGYLGKRTRRNWFYHPTTYLSAGKERDASDVAFITSEMHSSYRGVFTAHP